MYDFQKIFSVVKLVSRSLIQQRNIMKKYKGFWVCEIHADNFSTSSYFGDGEGFQQLDMTLNQNQ